MTQQEVDLLISWTLQLRHIDCTQINPGLKSIVVYSGKSQIGGQPPFSVQDYVDLANRADTMALVEGIADEVYNQSNGLIQTGVRADKSARPLKS